ncbi:MAG: hypothetical protein A2381_06685 [Bdellovibrionales bacterium RIFOXYB1_FULL_37_110]|nr:MAG: hypothetical protein A2181_08705 [Bdellovibrionales bacterium RIFOXYA1_FULL_38_20]OFZ50228.1 MAG: hypothetical protein A2417_19535 [Bdellovibrionales bacterium RIFOXYC1_FULL_37_79]OFZ57665.1 MAG: hypothetical protein A2381_06685 [Bdellovibrionales bacterium RIFOXYB1_FULL_37_110]OFZ61432.1 MAG: hypothetical protein A2577_01050 [Bdellovibrionales bacterium RIFOXYD1_FULL_36_51]
MVQPESSSNKTMDKLINFKIAKNKKEAFLIVKKNLTPKYLSQFKIEVELEYDFQNLEINAGGKGFKLEIKFEESYVSYALDLSLIYRPFKNKIVAALIKQLAQVI